MFAGRSRETARPEYGSPLRKCVTYQMGHWSAVRLSPPVAGAFRAAGARSLPTFFSAAIIFPTNWGLLVSDLFIARSTATTLPQRCNSRHDEVPFGGQVP